MLVARTSLLLESQIAAQLLRPSCFSVRETLSLLLSLSQSFSYGCSFTSAPVWRDVLLNIVDLREFRKLEHTCEDNACRRFPDRVVGKSRLFKKFFIMAERNPA